MSKLYQLYKQVIPRNVIVEYLTHISNDCIKNDKYMVVNANSFRKTMCDGSFKKFCATILKYYAICKQTYINRTHTYSSFLTVIRQVCRLHNMDIRNKRGCENKKSFAIYHIYNINSIDESIDESIEQS